MGQSLDSSDHPPRKKTRGYETSRKENLDSIRPEQPFGTANLPPSRARATTFALILDKSEPSSQLIRTAVMQFARLAIHNTRAFSKNSPRFQVLTVHGAKNREFGHVFIFWGYKKSGWPVEEQRRLLYNAVTRAKLDCTVLFLGDAERAVADSVINLLGSANPAINPEWKKKKKAPTRTSRSRPGA